MGAGRLVEPLYVTRSREYETSGLDFDPVASDAYMYVHVYNEPNRVDFLFIFIIVNV